MTDDPDRLPGPLTPRGAPAELRARTLAAVTGALAARRNRWRRRRTWAVAAGLLLAVALNGWVSRRGEARLAELYGPEPTPAAVADLARSIESAADADTARWVAGRLTPARRPAGDPFQRERVWIRLYSEFPEAVLTHVPAIPIPEDAGQNRRGAADRHSDRQCRAGVADRPTA
jgi:hypothetical protein